MAKEIKDRVSHGTAEDNLSESAESVTEKARGASENIFHGRKTAGTKRASAVSLHVNHRSRMRKRFLRTGTADMEEHNILELLLFYSIPRADTNIIAHRLIDSFGSLSGVFDAPLYELMKVEGIGEASAVLLKIIPGLINCYASDKLRQKTNYKDIESVGRFLTHYFLPKTEECIVIILLSGSTLLGIREIESGVSGMTDVTMRKIASAALAAGASSFIISHNHPMGKAKASQADVAATVNMMNVFEKIGLTLREHIIVSGDKYYCLLENLADNI